MGEKLALFGGPKAANQTFMRYNSIGKEEKEAVCRVMDSGVLSQFLGCWEPDFFGGPEIQAFEKEWADYFGVKHAVSVNSNTSGLMAAIGAIGIEPGDEVIVSPWTMCATATAALVWNAIPVFCDIEDETYGIDPRQLERSITPRTKAIIVTDLFGHAADLGPIMEIAKRHGLKVIEDCAQAPGAKFHGKYVGTVADIGVYSLNYHKHIHTGEGGVAVTNDPDLCERMQLIRNHGEAVVKGKGVTNLTNMVGYNFRLTELQAAIGREQLKKLGRLVETRQDAARKLTEGLSGLEGLRPPVVKPDCTHVYYDYAILLDSDRLKVSREILLKALTAEGVPNVGNGFTPLHLLPIYQKKIAFGSRGYPWNQGDGKISAVSYAQGTCPVVERLFEKSHLGIEFCTYEYNDAELAAYVGAFRKVWANLDALRSI